MDDYDIEHKIKQLTDEHRRMDDEIGAVMKSAVVNTIELQRLKKHKLQLKDEIARLQSMLYPDIIA